VLAAAGGCSPVDRHASWWVCRWAGTAVPATVASVTLGHGRWCARSGPSPASGRCPQSVAGSCRPSPDRHAEATSADRNRRPVMGGDGGRIGSLLLQGFHPVLGAPLAGVGRADTDHRDAAARGHTGQAITESSGGSRRWCGAIVFPACRGPGSRVRWRGRRRNPDSPPPPPHSSCPGRGQAGR
jgi:hypothetical protein